MEMMSSDDNTLAILQQFHDAFNRHDVDAVMALMTDDCVFENTYPPPDGERIEGAAAVRAFWEQLFAQSPQAFCCGRAVCCR
jgi:ketosteroid isomerase-like protein